MVCMSEQHKPIMFTHDCEACVHLGPFHHDRFKYDLYFCPTGGLGHETVVARYGNDGPEYVSGLHLANASPCLEEAVKRSRILGFIPEKHSK